MVFFRETQPVTGGRCHVTAYLHLIAQITAVSCSVCFYGLFVFSQLNCSFQYGAIIYSVDWSVYILCIDCALQHS